MVVVKAPLPPPTTHTTHDFFCDNRATGPDASSTNVTTMASFIGSGGRFPLVMVTCNRAEQLKASLASLLAVRCVKASDILVVADSCDGPGASEIPGVARSAGVAFHRHERAVAAPGEDGAARIASHYGYALGKGFELSAGGGGWADTPHLASSLTSPPAIIVVEDDMAFAPDFYEFFHGVAGLLEVDPTLWLASAWNDNGFDYLVADPLGVRRTSYFPGLGWLLPRELWLQELSAKWPPTHWDHWMREVGQHRGRDVVYPEVPRDYHMGVKGTFMDTGTHNKYFGSIALMDDPAFTWDCPQGAAAIEAVVGGAYQERLMEAIGGGDVTHLQSVGEVGAFTSGVGVVWYSCTCYEPDHNSARPLAAYFGVWHEGARGSKDGIHELWWQGTAKLYLVYVGVAEGQGVYPLAMAPNGAVSVAPSWILDLMPAGHTPIPATDFIGASRPALPSHKSLFGGKWRSPLAHIEGGLDGNGGADSGVEDSVQVYDASVGEGRKRLAAAGAPREDEHGHSGELSVEHKHSKFLSDLHLPAMGGGGSRVGVFGGEGVRVVASASPGLSCSEVCAEEEEEEEGKGGVKGAFKCHRPLLPFVNDCQTLRGKFSCAKCEDSVGADQPAFISLGAPNDKMPGLCLVNRDASLFSCDAKYVFAHRLCPCKKAKV